MKHLSFIVFIVTLVLLTGCATSERVSENTYRANLGTATEADIVMTVPRILDRNNFTIYRQEVTMDGVYIETEWKERDLFEDELSQGIVEARSRIYVNARPRTAQASSLHRVSMEVQNHVRFEAGGDWDRTILTEQTNEYLRDIERSIRTELATGIRRN